MLDDVVASGAHSINPKIILSPGLQSLADIEESVKRRLSETSHHIVSRGHGTTQSRSDWPEIELGNTVQNVDPLDVYFSRKSWFNLN